VKLVGRGMKRWGSPESAYDVEWEYDSTDDTEDRLLRVYELLLGLPEAPEIDPIGPETTCYVPGTIAVCPMAMGGPGK
jgi:hypothetical protein